MKLCGPVWGVVAGAGLCLAGILGIAYVRRAWEHTTFHPDWEMDRPALLVVLGLLVIVISVIVAVIGAIKGLPRRGADRNVRQ
jgi:hypothetical protein